MMELSLYDEEVTMFRFYVSGEARVNVIVRCGKCFSNYNVLVILEICLVNNLSGAI